MISCFYIYIFRINIETICYQSNCHLERCEKKELISIEALIIPGIFIDCNVNMYVYPASQSITVYIYVITYM